MRIPVLRFGLRGLVMLALAFGSTLAVVESGSVVLTKIQVPDDVRAVAHVAAAAAEHKPVTQQTTLEAYKAAAADARKYGITVQTKGFTLYPDGRITLTGQKTAPTLLLDRVGALRHFGDVTITVTVEPLPFS